MEKDKKRPRGLAAQRAAKKAKVSEEPEAPKDTQTVVLDKIVEEGDEIGEAAALYESALEKAESDPTSALQLIRGTVHECDRILRNWPKGDRRPPTFFYFVYGSALYELGRMTEDEDFGPYLDAAEERLQTGLERFAEEGHDEKDVEGEHAPNGVRLTAALAKVWLAKAATEIDEEHNDIPNLAQEALKNMQTIYVKGEAEYTPIPFRELVDLASAAQSHGDLYKDFDNQSKFREWAHSILLEITQEEPENARAFLELGLNRLSLANYWLEQVDEKMQDKDEETEEKKTRTPEEERAFEAIAEAKKHFLQSLEMFKQTGQAGAQIYADLAETCVNEANLMLTEEEQNKRYEEALGYIKEAQTAGGEGYSLPEGLQAFLDEWNENKE